MPPSSSPRLPGNAAIVLWYRNVFSHVPSTRVREGEDIVAGGVRALSVLPEELPAALRARTLGIHISVAVAWQRASAGDWAAYAAAVSRRTGTRATRPSK